VVGRGQDLVLDSVSKVTAGQNMVTKRNGWLDGWKKRLRISLRFFDLEASDEKKKKCALSSQIEKEMSICWL